MIEHLKELKLDDFVVFDLETTGTDCYLDRIIEIAAVRYTDGQITAKFSHLIDPGKSISEDISILTGIKNADLKGKPEIEDVLPDFVDFVGTSPLVGHNIAFDMGFLSTNLQSLEKIVILGSQAFYDTLILSQIFFPVEVPNHKLSSLNEYFGFNSDDLHRAYNDSEAAGFLFLRIIEKALNCSETTVRKLISVSGKSENIYIKEFFLKLANYFLKTSFGRKIKDKEKPYHIYNIIDRATDPSHSDLHSMSGQSAADEMFRHGGIFSQKIVNYEYREEQHVMASKCSDALRSDKILVCEAGTGVGKSYAYLVPSVISSLLNEERVVVSTNTKNLQEQIFFKDIPVIHDIFGSNFKAVLLKGRNNYLCRLRYDRIIERPDEYLTGDEYDRFMPLIVWAEKTNTGDIEENTGFKIGSNRFLWQKTGSDKGFCPGKKCPRYGSCYLQNIRRHATKTDLVIINHSLLFSDMASDNAVLGEYSRLIIDEAHNVESSATKYLGFEFNNYIMKNLMQRINNNNKQGIYIRIDRGSSWFKTDKAVIAGLNEELMEKSKSAADQTKKLFDLAMDAILSRPDTSAPPVRKRYKDIKEVFAHNEHNILLRSLYEDLILILKRLDSIFNTEAEKNHDFDDLSGEIKSVLDQTGELYEAFQFFLNSDRENYVFWYDVTGSGGKENLYLYAAPLDVSSILSEKLYANMKSIIFTSATMTIESRFKYMAKKLGLDGYGDDRLETLLLGTPFDLKSQLRIIAPSFVASPKTQVVYERDIADIIKFLGSDHDNGTLVLFTNYQQMTNVFYSVKNTFLKKDRLIAVQGRETNRTSLIKQFKAVRNSFLFGTDSFWEGIDVPGEALHTLILAKLPFAVPTDPVVQARIEELEKAGADSFMSYSVPETILKFRQGIGRLIRHRDDSGIIIILDSRTVNTRWGRAFLNSLPVEPAVPKTFADMKKMLLN
jgi:predicted DnaQ family exonuclease/DinG family helicase